MSDFESKVINAVRWFAIIKVLSQIFSWVITFYIMTILVKADYGLFALATVVIAFLTLVSELGLTAVLLQKKDLNVFHQRQIFGLVIIIGLVLATIILSTSSLIADFYNDERLVALLMALGIQFFLFPFYVIPRSTMERDLDFKSRSIIELLSSVVSSFITLYCAVIGLGVWALILGHLSTMLCRVVGYNYANPFKHWPTFNFKGIKPMLSFGGYTLGSRWMWFFSSNADIIIAGYLLKIDVVGLYKFATHIASLPAQKIAPIINQIAFPAFAKIQDDRELVAAHYLKAVGLLSLIAFPILWGLASIADFIPNYLGEQWRPAIPALRILCFVLPFRMLNGLTPSITGALGYPEIDFKNQAWLFLTMVPAYYIGCTTGGIMGLVYTWAIVFPLIIGRNLFFTLPIIGLTLIDLLKQMIIPLTLATTMFVTIIGIQDALSHINPHVLFAISIVSGIIIYTILTIFINRKMTMLLLRFVKN